MILKFFKRILAHIPTKLPQGVQEFHAWADHILDLYNMPNNDSTKNALATMVLHLPSTVAHKAMAFFGRALMKSASNQVVYQVSMDIKAAREAAMKAEQEATTAVENVASDVKKEI